jgi:hypothetical protein
MSLYVIPMVQEFYLSTNVTHIPDNRIVPTSSGRSGKIETGYLLEKSHPYYQIEGLYWKTIPLVSGIFILHIHEIFLGFIHSQLSAQKSYIILDHQNTYGVKLYLHPQKSTRLCLEVLDKDLNKFFLAETLEKVECRIFARLLHHYLYQGLIVEERLNGNVECLYSEKPFKLNTPEIYQ